MINKKSGVIIAAILALCCVFSAVYISSCTKPSKGPSCDNYGCQNGGYCSVDTELKNIFYPLSNGTRCDCPGSGVPTVHCNCPSGFEGANCGTAVTTKYTGTQNWDVKQTVIGSDTASAVGKVFTYVAFLIPSATPTTFFINNICDSNNYNDIVCTIDSTNSNNFVIDTLSAFHMFYQHFKFTQQGVGSISSDGATITATIWVRHLNYNINWQNDTLQMVLTQHKN